MKTKLKYDIYGETPVQGEGTIHGLAWYFRSRHSAWSFEVSTKEHLEIFSCSALYDDKRRTGQGAGYMPKAVAEKIIDACLALFEVSRSDLYL